jgi:hypothetical protein
MAGLRYDQLNFVASAKRKLKTLGSRVYQTLSFQYLDNKIEQFKYNTGNKIKDNFFR